MKNLFYFTILHLGAMFAAYFIGGFFNVWVFVPNCAMDLVVSVSGQTPSLFRSIGDYSFWESFWQILIFIGFSYLINSGLKVLSLWMWVLTTAFCTFILCVFYWFMGSFDFGLSKSFPDLGYESEQIARIMFFLSLELAFVVGYSFMGKVNIYK